jgi:hypothetical protein
MRVDAQDLLMIQTRFDSSGSGAGHATMHEVAFARLGCSRPSS